MLRNISIKRITMGKGDQEYNLYIKCNNNNQVKMVTNTLQNMFKEVKVKSSKQNTIKLFYVKDRLNIQLGGAIYFRHGETKDTSLYVIAHFAPNSKSLRSINMRRSMITSVVEALPHLTLFDLHFNQDQIEYYASRIKHNSKEMLKSIMPQIAMISCQFKDQLGALQHDKYEIIGINPYIVDEYKSFNPALNNLYDSFKTMIVNYSGLHLFDINVGSLNNFTISSTNPLFHVFGPEKIAFARYYQNLLKLHISLSSVNNLDRHIDLDTIFNRLFIPNIQPSELKYIEVSILNWSENINIHYVLNCDSKIGNIYVKNTAEPLYLSPQEIYRV